MFKVKLSNLKTVVLFTPKQYQVMEKKFQGKQGDL